MPYGNGRVAPTLGLGGTIGRCGWYYERYQAATDEMTPTQVIEEIGARLARAAPPKSRVLLFGSHARGTADAGSDFDVLVIEPTVDRPIAEAVRLRRELR